MDIIVTACFMKPIVSAFEHVASVTPFKSSTIVALSVSFGLITDHRYSICKATTSTNENERGGLVRGRGVRSVMALPKL